MITSTKPFTRWFKRWGLDTGLMLFLLIWFGVFANPAVDTLYTTPSYAAMRFWTDADWTILLFCLWFLQFMGLLHGLLGHIYGYNMQRLGYLSASTFWGWISTMLANSNPGGTGWGIYAVISGLNFGLLLYYTFTGKDWYYHGSRE